MSKQKQPGGIWTAQCTHCALHKDDVSGWNHSGLLQITESVIYRKPDAFFGSDVFPLSWKLCDIRHFVAETLSVTCLAWLAQYKVAEKAWSVLQPEMLLAHGVQTKSSVCIYSGNTMLSGLISSHLWISTVLSLSVEYSKPQCLNLVDLSISNQLKCYISPSLHAG